MWGCEFVYQSATSLVGCFFFTIGYLFFVLPKDTQGKIVHSIHRGYNFILVAMAITVFMIHYLIVVYQIQNKFAYLVEVVLKKDLTFSTRTIIWNSAINMIEKSFLIFSELPPYCPYAGNTISTAKRAVIAPNLSFFKNVYRLICSHPFSPSPFCHPRLHFYLPDSIRRPFVHIHTAV